MNPWNFFNKILVINLPHRTDRLAQVKEELSRVGMLPFGSVVNYSVQIIPGIQHENPTLGFNQAQRNALEAAEGITLILEDDVTFHNTGHLEAALSELPADWDLLYLGANSEGSNLCNWPVPSYVSPNLRRITQAWTTHAIAYSEAGRKKILADWDHTNGQIFDDYLRCSLEKLNAYIIYPMIADQRPGFSDIWNRDVNYGFFESGNKRMEV